MKNLAYALLLSLALIGRAAAQEPEDELGAPTAAQEPAKEGSSVPLEILVGVVAINLVFPGAALASLAWGGQWYVWRTAPSQPSAPK